MTQLQLNFNHCIFDHFIIPKNDDWVWELKEKKEKVNKLFEVIKEIYEQTNFK